MMEFLKKPPQWMKWLWLALAVAAYCGVILSMQPKQAPKTPKASGETQEETQPETEPEAVVLPWNLQLINPWNPIPRDFSVELAELEDGQTVDARIYPELQQMLADMRAEGLDPLICSAYRTDEKQQSLYSRKVESYLDEGLSLPEADAEAGKWVAVPGTSEHQTGLAADIIDTSYPYLDEAQENTAVQQWLMANSWQYGFILRYPSEKSDITGIYYEPWHYRYVGKDAAKEIYEQGICLEEYLEALEK